MPLVDVTIRLVDPDTPEVALIVVLPVAIPVANPPTLIVAFVRALDAHVTVDVQFVTVEFDHVQVAAYCRVPLMATDELTGVTAMLVTVGAVTVKPVDPTIAVWVAEMVVDPVAIPAASPPADIVALLGALLAHATVKVQFVVVASDHVQMAVYWAFNPTLSNMLAGVTAMLLKVTGAVIV